MKKLGSKTADFLSSGVMSPETAKLLQEHLGGDIFKRLEELSYSAHRLSTLTRGAEIIVDAVHGGMGMEYEPHSRTAGFMIEFASIISDAAAQLDDEMSSFEDFVRKVKPKKN